MGGAAIPGIGAAVVGDSLLNREQGAPVTDKWGLGRALSARYDERSQILYELNKPIISQTFTRRTKNTTTEMTVTLSKLELILILAGVWSLANDHPILTFLMDRLGLSETPTESPPTTTDGNNVLLNQPVLEILQNVPPLAETLTGGGLLSKGVGQGQILTALIDALKDGE